MSNFAAVMDPDQRRRSSRIAITPAMAEISGARQGALPAQPRPQLATLAGYVPDGAEWIQEIKFDGYRVLAALDNGHVRLLTRNGKDWTAKFPEIAAQLLELTSSSALLDGEIVAFRKDGISSFGRLQECLADGRTTGLVYQVFDLLHLDGLDLTHVALLDRKHLCAELLDRAGLGAASDVRFTEHFAGGDPDFFSHACRLGLEGIICKQAGAHYRPGRNRNWLKVKCTRHEELLIAGYTDPEGSRHGFGALLLGAYDRNGGFGYVGKVGTGFSDRQLSSLHARLRKMEIADCPFSRCPDTRAVHWVRPTLVAEVEFTEWTRDGRLRHASFRGLREDKNPEDIQMPETSVRTSQSIAHKRRHNSRHDVAKVAGIEVTHPDRVVYPGQGVTKLALARYYEAVGEHMLGQVRGRPLSLMRCPEGREGECFFQKHPGQSVAESVPRIDIEDAKGTVTTYLYVEHVADIVALVQAGTLELHAWGSRVDDLERPDTLVFDLDPAEDVPWNRVLRGARTLRDRLRDLGLDSFVRTTGGKGLHIVVPLAPARTWDELKEFARGVAIAHANDAPDRYTCNMSKARRQGRIFIDYLRNARGATAIASFSTRARVGAPVAVPLRWSELRPALLGNHYTIKNLERRLSALSGDPWEGYEACRRELSAGMLAAVGAGNDGSK